MNPHLTESQLYDLLSGDSTATAASHHLASCARCRAEFDSLRDTLSSFRLAATNLSLTHVPFRRAVETPSRPTLLNRSHILWASGLATAAVAVAIVLPTVHPKPTPTQTPTVATDATARLNAESDEALLSDIDRDLSTSVPTPLEPLTGTSSSGSTSTSNPN